MTLHSAFAVLFTILDLACIIAVIFFERKNPASTIAWALVLLFLPFVGFAAYVMFGSGFHVNKKKRYALKQLSDNVNKSLMAQYTKGDDVAPDDDVLRCERMVTYLEKDGLHKFTNDNAIRLFTDGNDMFAHMLDDIRSARSSIHMLYYIIRNDPLGRELTALLTEKARQGVTVRVIYDSLGSILTFGRMFAKLRAAGGEVQAFSPLFFKLSSHLRLNYRNHRKITVVDGHIGYVGGMNVGVDYLGMNAKLSPWRDTHLRITGSSVGFLQERFLLDWVSVSDDNVFDKELESLFPAPVDTGRLGVQIVSSGPDTAENAIKSGLLEMLYAARKRVFIQTPYFTPDDSFLDALRIAAGSGVDVRLMLPGRSDHMFVGWATDSYARQLLDFGVRLFKYNGFLHAKTMVFDGIAASIGTANIGNRSFTLNFEVNAFIYDRDFARLCEGIFESDQQCSEEVNPDWFASRSPAVRAAYSVCRLFAPLI